MVRALVADDVRENRDVLSGMLTAIGVEVVAAEDGLSALRAVRESRPDIAFLDIRMPGMDGQAAAAAIRRELGDDRPKLVAVSASALAHQAQDYLRSGFDDFLPKPFHAEALYACLQQLLCVAYEYEVQAEEPPAISGALCLSDDLIERLWAAAKLSNISQVERLLPEVEACGVEARRFADHIRQLSRDLRMADIARAIENARIRSRLRDKKGR